MKLHRKRLRSGVAALSIVLAVIPLISACAPAPTEPPPTPTATMPPPSETPSPVPTETATLPPTPTPTPFVPTATIKIALHGPLTGDYSSHWMNVVNAAELAVANTAPSFEELGYEIQLVSYDDQGDFSPAVANAKEIVADEEILCGVGHFLSRIFIQTKEIYHRAGLAFISPSATSPRVTTYSYPEIFRIVGRDDAQGAVGALFAKSRGFGRAFVINQTNDYSQLNAYQFRSEAGRQGLEVVGVVRKNESTGFQSAVDAVISTQADVVYFSTLSLDQAGRFFREARAAGYEGAFLGPESLAYPALLDAAGPLVTEGDGLFHTSTAAPPRYYPEAEEFVSEYQTRFDQEPMAFSAQAYDAAGVCLRAMRDAIEAKDGQLPTRAEVTAAIRSLQEYRGVTGTVAFDEDGELDPARYFVLQVISADPQEWNQNTIVEFYDLAPPE